MATPRDYSSLAVYGNLSVRPSKAERDRKNKKPQEKKTKPKISDLMVYANLSVRPSRAERALKKKAENQLA